MAEEISEERFKDEMIDIMKAAILKIGEDYKEIALFYKEIALLKKDFDKNTRELKSLRKETRANSGLDNDVRFRVLEMFNWLFEIEKQVDLLDCYTSQFKGRTYTNLSRIIKVG